jgi:Nidogen-like
MLFGLLRREKAKTAPLGGWQAARRVRLELEPLENRLVPTASAIRNLSGFLANNLPANDDGSTAAVNIGFNINFFGVQTNQCFCNNNGNITLNQPLATFTPFGLTTALGEPIIAPFFADVDTRGNSDLMTYGNDTLCGLPVFGVDWIHVNYFDATTGAAHVNKFNDFQLILIDRADTGPGNFDIEFNYNTINWETGDASGGTNGLGGSSAHVGYSNGTGNAGTFAEFPGSGVNGAFLDGGPDALISNMIDSNTVGRYHFAVREGQVMRLDVSKGAEITGLVGAFHPIRYLLNQGSQVYSGNVSVTPTPSTLSSIAACLDETAATDAVSLAGRYQVTIVYESLPPGVTLLNATGVTAAGHPYISTPDVVNFGPGLVLRFPVRFSNPNRVPISTFLQGPNLRVFAGPFNPANE